MDWSTRAALDGQDMAGLTNEQMAKTLERFRVGIASHDRENPTHTAYGIGLAHFEMERLGFDEGEELWAGITVHVDGGTTGNFRVLCHGDHGRGETQEAEEIISAVGTEV